MEVCTFQCSLGGDYHNDDLSAPAIDDETGVKAAELYADCVNNAAQTGAAGADYNDSIAVCSEGNALRRAATLAWPRPDGTRRQAAAHAAAPAPGRGVSE